MAPTGQRTFALIPTTLATATGSRPAMTSKAAKKAYAKANQGPKVSRAEKRRLEAEELAQQKREFEKEKAARKAKAAREKKQEKEEQARLERRRNGEPEKSKWVRASQPSIARFVKSENGKRKWKDVDEESEGTVVEDDHGEREPPAKRLAVVAEEEDEERNPAGGIENYEQAQESRELETEVAKVQQDEDSEDEFGDFPSLSQTELLESIDNRPSSSGGLNVRHAELSTNQRSKKPTSRGEPSQELPKHRTYGEEGYLFGSTQDVDDLVSAQIRSEEAEAIAKSDTVEPPLSARKSTANQMIPILGEKNNPELRKVRTYVRSSPAVSTFHQSTHTSKFGKSTPHAPFTSRIPGLPQPYPRNRSNQPPPSTQAFLEANLDDFMPSPSQALRELLDDTDVDDLPTNTQIARDISPLRTWAAVPRKLQHVEENFDDLICTQDLILSSQDMREISPVKAAQPTEVVQETTRPKPPVFKKPYLPRNKALQPKGKVVTTKLSNPVAPTVVDKQLSFEDLFDSFPSTQELVLTPEDLKEIGTSSRPSVVTGTRNNLALEMIRLLDQNNHVLVSPPREQTEMKGDLPRVDSKPTIQSKERSRASLTSKMQENLEVSHPDRSSNTATRVNPQVQSRNPSNPSKPQTSQEMYNRPPNSESPRALRSTKSSDTHQGPPYAEKLSNTHTSKSISSAPTPYTTKSKPLLKQKQRFFEEKETDLFKAALHESKIMAEQQYFPPRMTTAKPPMKQSSGNKMALRNEDKVAEKKATKNVSGINGREVKAFTGAAVSGNVRRERRTLQRAQSAATDYGDDDFEGLSEADLKGLC